MNRINVEEDIHPVSNFRANAAAILDRVRDTGRPVVLTQRGKSTAVLLDVRAYQTMVDELDTLREIHAGMSELDRGEGISQAELRAKLTARYSR